ncbi:Orn/Lys/Arg decarboxylase N-terminal domain-containing protein [Aquipseudomonas alcaligenes]|uniref:Lysine-specific pyridoxal 5'-phosphate-dependent carboxylase LdcA n=1 Tax=Aquipseudomonas alcaligenes TaxID=43263 RepID=A0AA37CE18_AQUAC|nr:Orn/Lys/Arg decarboxylase N-terminal domain-containing protein [Pseudomonas alcaligenes]BCR24980.1 lysine-specific pyridoxal 5'-phosphate-dependent carboxylase LdcA [Pseudomonas alcaligenes]GIZ65906.1 lysine-specific pyridoxal 5'-phosphate-dependent carboxylase LdcA [Pseudomonas alcaligenes]GIZ70500.1 lysine-specific pyridoxal 5'-phosphate-dependent carboxylase LdcA [Pseudomonas alcaligenes]GIZ74854.1 lysine-specific pyridoxal 5'-phosphate-dependent carboxylase LdcA [Pseudomonas alcaligenes]
MYKDLNFPILIVHRDIKADTVAGERVRAIAEELGKDGFTILSTASSAEGRIVASTHHGLACILVAAEGAGENQRLLQDMVELIRIARVRAPQLPIFALGEQVTIENAPADAMADLNHLRGILYLYEDTVSFLARQVARAAHNYLDGLLPPFFKALVQHTAQSNYSWHTPGHGGGVAYRKSPVGQAFHQFFGENTLRSDLSVSVPELGSLLDHTGPLAEAEARAARNFGADHTFFVINGTSTANKIVWHSMVGRDDLVLVDRNCHKSILHSIIMTGAIPLYLCPERNELGIIGPIPLSEFSKESIQAKIDASPLARGRAPKVKLAVVTNSTYDGLCYNAEMVKQALGDSVEVLHFDEAWYAYAAFHEFYAGRYGMGTRCEAHSPLVFSTHSTHKLLAAFSQASMIHVQDGGARQLDRDRFNEAFMMHISTSPQYGIIASLDVASAMMEGPAGRSLIQETFDEALSFRRALANLRQNLKADDWWFSIWQPDQAGGEGVHTGDWLLQPNADWHGFGEIAEDYVLLDPIKVTLVMPGLSADGKLTEAGIPAAVVSKFLWERGLVVEKTGLYSFLVLFSMGITKGKWSTLLTELLEFKRLYDANVPLLDALPSIAREGGARYAGMGLRDLCDELHGCYRENATAKALKHMYTVLPQVAIKPADAYDKLVRGEVEAVPIEQLEGRLAAVMLVPYPPGIPLIMPGERFTAETRSIIDYLQFARTFDSQFPGFDADVHGLQRDGACYTVDCIKE